MSKSVSKDIASPLQVQPLNQTITLKELWLTKREQKSHAVVKCSTGSPMSIRKLAAQRGGYVSPMLGKDNWDRRHSSR